jgi:uncharacterized protein YegP (UPF0339 family)
MRTFIKILGPPTLKAIKALEASALKLPQVCVMSPTIADEPSAYDSIEDIGSYFGGFGEISEERCGSIISQSGTQLGIFDFYYQWYQIPTLTEIHTLIKTIDEALEPIGVMYKAVTSPAFDINPKPYTDEEAEEILKVSIDTPKTMQGPRFEVFTDIAGEYRFRLIAPNNKIIGVSEGYTTKEGCMQGVNSVIKNVSKAETVNLLQTKSKKTQKAVFETFKDVAEHYRFRLRAPNYEIILASQAYISMAGANNGVESVRRNGPKAKILDIT